MKNKIVTLSVIAVLFAVETIAQQTSNYLTKFSTPPSLVNSSLFENVTGVGLGTITPADKLHINASGGGILRLTHNNTSYLISQTVNTGTIRNIALQWNSNYTATNANETSAIKFGYYADPNGKINNAAIRFYTQDNGSGATQERMSIVAGNLGIGTTSPGNQLTIAKDLGILTTDLQAAHTFSCSPVHNRIMRFNCNSGVGSGGWEFYNADPIVNKSLMSVQQSGSVGIGTATPVALLNIEGGSANWSETTPGISAGTLHLDPRVSTDHCGNAITFGSSDHGNGELAHAGIYVRSDGSYGTKMYFGTTDNYTSGSKMRMMIDHLGNLGIGTISPNAKLDVNGTIRVNNNAIYLRGGTDLNHGLVFDAGIDGSRLFGFQGVAFGTTVGGTYSEKMRVTPDGVNIGAPRIPAGYLLAVGGRILATEVVVRLIPDWPDYVFKKGYKLKTLNELEEYVETNHHLPGIPSAKEIDKNGLSLGDVVTRQMEKIEELSLYLIEINKKLEKLEEENKQMKASIKK